MIYRLPTDPYERASIFSKEQRIRVNEGEVAALIKDGTLQAVLEPGTYRTEKTRFIGDVDVVWIKTGPRLIRWGLGHVMSQDGIEVGANGTVTVAVEDGAVFNSEVIQGALTLPDTELQRILLPGIQGVLRTLLAQQTATGLMHERQRFVDAVRNGLGEYVGTLGMGIRAFEVADFSLPAEFRDALASEAVASARGRGRSVEARVEAERQLLEAQTEAAAMLVKGEARAKVFAHLRAQGIDPMGLEAMEILKAYAENPPQGGVLGGDAARAGLIGSIASAAMNANAAAQAAASASTPAQILQQLQSGSSAGAAEEIEAEEVQPLDGTRAPAESGPSGNGGDLEALRRQLDGLTTRLAEGELSEELYLRLATRIEGRIAELEGE
jgi:regulator of protease activity HflC (stomatin/prohibitin superfamily)